MDKKEILLQLEEDIEKAAIIKHHAETIFRLFLGAKIENAVDAIKVRAEALIDDLFWLYKILCSQSFESQEGVNNDS